MTDWERTGDCFWKRSYATSLFFFPFFSPPPSSSSHLPQRDSAENDPQNQPTPQRTTTKKMILKFSAFAMPLSNRYCSPWCWCLSVVGWRCWWHKRMLLFLFTVLLSCSVQSDPKVATWPLAFRWLSFPMPNALDLFFLSCPYQCRRGAQKEREHKKKKKSADEK